MGASLTNLLVSKRPSQHLAEHGRVTQSFESFVQTVYQGVEKLQSIMLFPQIYRLTP